MIMQMDLNLSRKSDNINLNCEYAGAKWQITADLQKKLLYEPIPRVYN